jgi:carboxyl-terminal processing protease
MKFLRVAGRFTRHLPTGLLFAAVFAFGVVVGNQNPITRAQVNPDTSPPIDAEENFAPFWEVYNLIQKIYIDEIETSALVDGAINGMLEALDDQFSGYVEPQFNEFADDLSGRFSGIGVTIRENEEANGIEVIGVIEGTPAAQAGLRQGDIFVTVDGEDVTGFSTSQLAARVRGPVGTVVNITMRRGEELVDFAIQRAIIEVTNIEYSVLEENNIAYIKLNQFTIDARSQIDEALSGTDAANRTGLILDLRGNPGGLLNAVVQVTSAFVEDGVLLYEQFNDGTEETIEADGSFAGLDIPIVVLVNAESASGSEIVAGTLKERNIATVIGETTFGKGVVQTRRQLVNGGGLTLVIARWLTPERNWIQEQGITPNIVIEWPIEAREANPDDDPQLNAAIEQILAAD